MILSRTKYSSIFLPKRNKKGKRWSWRISKKEKKGGKGRNKNKCNSPLLFPPFSPPFRRRLISPAAFSHIPCLSSLFYFNNFNLISRFGSYSIVESCRLRITPGEKRKSLLRGISLSALTSPVIFVMAQYFFDLLYNFTDCMCCFPSTPQLKINNRSFKLLRLLGEVWSFWMRLRCDDNAVL